MVLLRLRYVPTGRRDTSLTGSIQVSWRGQNQTGVLGEWLQLQQPRRCVSNKLGNMNAGGGTMAKVLEE